MEIQLNDWAYDDLKKKLKNLSIVEAGQFYQELGNEMTAISTTFLTDSAEQRVINEGVYDELNKRQIIVAIHIAKRLIHK